MVVSGKIAGVQGTFPLFHYDARDCIRYSGSLIQVQRLSMNRIFGILTPLFGIVFLAFLLISIRTLSVNRFSSTEKETNMPERINHYAFFLPTVDNAFYTVLKTAALREADEYDCAITFYSTTSEELSFEMVQYSGINGVAVFLYDTDKSKIATLSKIANLGIPIVQIENELISGYRTALVGTNSYDAGKSIGRIALKAANKQINIAVIYSERNPGFITDENLLEMGLSRILTDAGRLDELFAAKTSLNPIDAESVVYSLIENYPELNMLALTDTSDTLVSINAVIDRNLVDKINIIGFGDDPAILDYLGKGVILGSINSNPDIIGAKAVKALKEINSKGFTSGYHDTGVRTIMETVESADAEGGQ